MCTTRDKKNIVLCYYNIKNASQYIYKTKPATNIRPQHHPLSSNLYVSTENGTNSRKIVSLWNDDGIARLRGCFDCFIWDRLHDSCSSVSDFVDTVTSYMSFCVDTILPQIVFLIYPLDKPMDD